MKSIFLVKVPDDSYDFFINQVGCLRYSHNEGRESTAIEPSVIGAYLSPTTHKIIEVSIVDGEKTVIIESLEAAS